jgi:hypothetical protein
MSVVVGSVCVLAGLALLVAGAGKTIDKSGLDPELDRLRIPVAARRLIRTLLIGVELLAGTLLVAPILDDGPQRVVFGVGAALYAAFAALHWTSLRGDAGRRTCNCFGAFADARQMTPWSAGLNGVACACLVAVTSGVVEVGTSRSFASSLTIPVALLVFLLRATAQHHVFRFDIPIRKEKLQ